MRILVTNDDGINAPGLSVLEAIAHKIAGATGEVWTVAPAFEQSGVGHAISYTHPTMIVELAPRRFAAEGTPADCVLAGVHDVLRGKAPDLILSGVNRGNNSGENVVYSGTVGGAMEGALQGIPSIALSQFLGPQTNKLDNMFEAAMVHGAETVQNIVTNALWDTDADYRLFYNVNFPPVSAADVRGLRVTRQGYRPNNSFKVEPHLAPSGRRFLWVRGSAQAVDTAPGTDVGENLKGYITVTPLRADLTAHDTLKDLKGRLE
jgi:5'-nucleotidase